MSKKQSRLRFVLRRSLLERMEDRILLAGDVGHNFLLPGDVNNDHQVRASDALAIINQLGMQVRSERVAPESEAVDASLASMFFDVNDDGQVSASDALRVINELASVNRSIDASEFLDGDGGAHAKFELELKTSGVTELEIRLADAPVNQLFEVTIGGEVLGQIQTNDQGRGKMELKYGASGPALPTVLAMAVSTTPVSIGDVVVGTLGSLGKFHSEMGGSQEPLDPSSHSEDEMDDGIDEDTEEDSSDEDNDNEDSDDSDNEDSDEDDSDEDEDSDDEDGSDGGSD